MLNINKTIHKAFLCCALGLSFSTSSLAHGSINRRVIFIENKVDIETTASSAHVDKQLESLSTQLHQTIVMEGMLTSEDRENVASLFKPVQVGTPRETLDKVAKALNCSVQEEGNVLLLQRDYSLGSALPYLTVEEAKRTVESLNSLLSTIDNSTYFEGATRQNGTYAANFIRNISDSERSALQSGIPIASLSPAQQQECWRLVAFATLNTKTEPLRIVEQDLEAVAHKQGDFLIKPLKPSVQTAVFGYEYVSNQGRLLSRPLSHPEAGYVRGGSLYSPLLGFDGGTSKSGTENALAQATEPSGKPISEVSENQLTLDTVCSRLNHSGLAEPIQAVPAVGKKLSTLYGVNFSSPETLLKAICRLHGLRTTRKADSTGAIVRYVDLPPVARPVPLSELRAALRQAFPASLYRVVWQKKTNAAVPQPQDSALAAKELSKIEQIRIAQLADRKILTGMRVKVTKYLREVVEPQMSTSKRLALSESGTEAQDTMALLQLLDMIDVVDKLTLHSFPEAVTQFPQLYISAGTARDDSGLPLLHADGKYSYQIVVGPRDEKGKVKLGTLMQFPIEKPVD